MAQVKIASFNVNSVKARLPNLLLWLKQSNPDIVCLQELKCLEENFPFEEILDAGYNAVVSGQKSYNGVAILSKFKMEDVIKELPILTQKEDPQSRYIEAIIPINDKAIRVSSIYVPNGGGTLEENERLEDSAKFQYKMEFFDRLKSHFSSLLKYDEMQIFAGDYNVAAEEIDVFDPKSLKNTVCFHDLERAKFRELLNIGFADSFRATNNEMQNYSWWDYRGGAWQHNKGLRIDYLLTSPKATDKIVTASIEDREVRDQEKASDHCPAIVVIDI
jgi:exodeoxyribonuclease III